MAADLAGLKEFLGIPGATTTDEAAMQSALDAANSWVLKQRPDWTTDPDTGAPLDEWDPDVDMAAKIEAARLYGRRGSSQGVAAFADVGVVYIPGTDPTVRELLELGSYQRSVVA